MKQSEKGVETVFLMIRIYVSSQTPLGWAGGQQQKETEVRRSTIPCRSRYHCPLSSCRDPVPGHRCQAVSPSGHSHRGHSQENFCSLRNTDGSSAHQTLFCRGSGQREHHTGHSWSPQHCNCKPGTPAPGPDPSMPLHTPHTSAPACEAGRDTLQRRGHSYSGYEHSHRVCSRHPGMHRNHVNTCHTVSQRHLVHSDTVLPPCSCQIQSLPHCSYRAHSQAPCPTRSSQTGTGHTAVLSREVCSHTVQSPDGRRQKGSHSRGSHRLGSFWQSRHLHRSHLHTSHNGHRLCSISTSGIPP